MDIPSTRAASFPPILKRVISRQCTSSTTHPMIRVLFAKSVRNHELSSVSIHDVKARLFPHIAFGPICPLLKWSDEDDVVQRASACDPDRIEVHES
jgi:hypothetical protein